MSVQAITWALDYAAGSVTEKVLLLVLANYANEFGVSWPSQKTLADQTALGERTVRRVLADMERRGVIRRIVRRRGNGSRQSDMILLAAFEGRKPAPPGMLDDGPDGAEIDAPDQPAHGDNRPMRPLDNRPPDPDPPATVAALDTSKILKRTTTARDVPKRAFSEPVGDQGAAPAADAEAACLTACGPGLGDVGITGKHVELRARQMQHFQGIYSSCSEDLCGSDRTAPRLSRCPPGPRFHPGLRCMRGAEAR